MAFDGELLIDIFQEALDNSKDFYDVYLLYRLKSDEIDFDKLALACQKTFNYRETILDLVSFKEMISMILNDKGFNDRWNAYAIKNTYVKDISFVNVI